MLNNKFFMIKVFFFSFAFIHMAPTDLLCKEIKEAKGEKDELDKKKEEANKSFNGEALDIKKRDHEYFANRSFFKLSPIRVPIVQNGVWVADLFCRLDCEVQNDEDYLEVSRIFYTLVDAAFTTLYTTLGERFLVKSPLEVEVWRPLLKKAIEHYVPIKNLYFRQFCLVEYHRTPPTSRLATH